MAGHGRRRGGLEFQEVARQGHPLSTFVMIFESAGRDDISLVHEGDLVIIDRSSPVPLYHQLSEQLTAAIADGTQAWRPVENELAWPSASRPRGPPCAGPSPSWSPGACWSADVGWAPSSPVRSSTVGDELTSLYDGCSAGARSRAPRSSPRHCPGQPTAAAALRPAAGLRPGLPRTLSVYAGTVPNGDRRN